MVHLVQRIIVIKNPETKIDNRFPHGLLMGLEKTNWKTTKAWRFTQVHLEKGMANIMTSKGTVKGGVNLRGNQAINRFNNKLNINVGGIISAINKIKVRWYYLFHLGFWVVPSPIVVFRTQNSISFFTMWSSRMEELCIFVPRFNPKHLGLSPSFKLFIQKHTTKFLFKFCLIEVESFRVRFSAFD